MTILYRTTRTDAEAVAGEKQIAWVGPNKWEVRTGVDLQKVDVPTKVTRRQFRQGLTRLGLRAGVDAWRAGLDTSAQAGQDAADWYDDSNEFERHNPILNAMAAQFGLSSAQVDAAFVMMAGL
ncbi:hypothetical protein [Zoogloea sp.]|uniref:hypothetical protein n=1 Tax=Zoogloea sp. TaxID=49181 RepID=UPI0025E25323|nr:hypothetical protein [Zoogloea sp.]MCK6396073.1 hypothetical protein [Zoogloea sp.]